MSNEAIHIDVIAPGSECLLRCSGDEPVRATVDCVRCYAGGFIQYQVSWWDGRYHRQEWLEAYHIDAANPPSARLGFRFVESTTPSP